MSKERDDEAWGDYPAGKVPGLIGVDSVANPLHLRERVSEYLISHRHILKGAKKAEQEIVAFASCHGKEMLIGAGVIGVISGALVIYPRWKARQQRLGKGK